MLTHQVSHFGQWAKRTKLSVWLSFIVLCIALASMQPGLQMIFWVPILLVLVFGLRWVSHLEGKASLS